MEKDGRCVINCEKSMEIIEYKDRNVKHIIVGSICFVVNCPTVDSLDDLWTQYTSNRLLNQLYLDLQVDYLKQKYKLPNLFLSVIIKKEHIEICRKEIEASGEHCRPIHH